MQHNNYPRKYHKETSLQQEMNQGLAHCPPDRTVVRAGVRGLRSIEHAPGNSLNPLYEVEQRGNHKTELIAQGTDSKMQSDDEGLWRDDGGESG